ncbi:RloB family protein [Segatella oris]|uniref:RloB family protein n=1 Tax=Segatella oris TaxID=28135 RepID=UPI0028E1C3E2|nr:RloB family protein [Segatella oris]
MRKTRNMRGPLVSSGRKQGTRDQIVRFLIVCEGKKTEPNYFRALIDDCKSQNNGAKIDRQRTKVSLVTKIDEGAGGTGKLVEKAKKLKDEYKRKKQIHFDRVWLVFDKDEFMDFNKAIADAKKEKMNCAWSNGAFELWFLLHFQNGFEGKCKDYVNKIESILKKKLKKTDFSYEKNDEGFYQILQEHGDEEQAIKRAQKLRENRGKKKNYAAHNPRTEVDLLVDELRHPEKALDKIEEAMKACKE